VAHLVAFRHAPLGDVDFDQVWQAALALRAGEDPYTLIGPGLAYPFGWPLYYPGTAAVLALPFSQLPIGLARLAFVAGAGGVFGYAIGKYRAYLWPVFLSAPFLFGARNAQWAPLLTAAMLIPALGWLAAAKPNLGVVVLLASKTRRQAWIVVAGGAVLCAVALALDPNWPRAWLHVVESADHFKPLLSRPGGWLMLLALLRWRSPDARLLLGLACVPVGGMFYDALPAFLVTRTRREALVLAVLSLVASIGVGFDPTAADWSEGSWRTGQLVLWGILLPAMALLMLRKEAT
jgi:hypothetical protein